LDELSDVTKLKNNYMEESKNSIPKESDFLFYKTLEGNVKIEVFFQNETVWLTQQLLAELFSTTKQNISLHLKNAFNDGELAENSVVKEFLTTAKDGKQYKIKYYNLDAIISVGYRVNSMVECNS
jgi:hypothetical protein